MKDFTTMEEPKNTWLTSKKFLTFSILLLFFINIPKAIAQDPDGYPGDILRNSHCPANDLTVFDAFLQGADECIDCSKTNSFPLILGINNKTGSTRTSFSFWAVLETTDSEGKITRTAIKGCNGPIEGKGDYFLEFGLIDYTCGTTLELKEIYMAYTDASGNDNRQCGAYNEEGGYYEPVNPSSISPKCGTSIDRKIRTPLGTSGDVTNVSCEGANDGFIEITFSGGTGPYYLA